VGIAALSRLSLTYAFGGLAYKAVALLSVPLLARLLTPAELGLLDFAAVLASIVGLTALVGADQAIPYHETRVGDRARLWSTAIALIGALALGLAVLGVVFQVPLGGWLTGQAGNGSIMAAAALYGGTLAISTLALTAVRLLGPPSAYAIVSFLLVSMEMTGAVAVALIVRSPVPLMIMAWSLGAAVVAIPVLVRYIPRLRRPSRQFGRRLIRFGLPLVPAALAWLVGDAWIRSVLAREADPVVLGEYGIAHRVASVLGLLVSGFGVAWHPYIYASPVVSVADRATSTGISFLLVLAGIGAGLTLTAPEVISLVAGPGYAGAREAVAALCAAMVALGAIVLVGAVIGRSGSTKRIAVAAFIGLIVQATTSVSLIDIFGLSGAALASAGGYVVAAACLLATEPRLLTGRRGLRMIVGIGSAGGVLIVAALSGDLPFLARLAVGIVLGLALGILGRLLHAGETLNADG